MHSHDVNEYLHEAGEVEITAKDFRTWVATVSAAGALGRLDPPESEREEQASVRGVVTQVAEELGNTPAIGTRLVHPSHRARQLRHRRVGPGVERAAAPPSPTQHRRAPDPGAAAPPLPASSAARGRGAHPPRGLSAGGLRPTGSGYGAHGPGKGDGVRDRCAALTVMVTAGCAVACVAVLARPGAVTGAATLAAAPNPAPIQHVYLRDCATCHGADAPRYPPGPRPARRRRGDGRLPALDRSHAGADG